MNLLQKIHDGFLLVIVFSMIAVIIIAAGFYFVVNDYFGVFDDGIDEAMVDKMIKEWKKKDGQ